MAQDKIFVPVEFNADIEDFEKKIKSARDLVKAFAKEVKGVKRFGASFEEIEKVSVSLGKALGNVNKRVENLSDRLDKNARRNEEAAEKLEKTKEKAEKAASALKETKEQTKRLSDELKKTKEKTEGLGRGLDKTKDKTKDTGKGFGKLGEGVAEGSYALTNLGYIISDIPHGFIGIQNNIDPLVASFARLSTASGGAENSLKVLGRLLSGPTGIFLGITTVSSLALMFGDKLVAAITGSNAKLREFNLEIAEMRRQMKLAETSSTYVGTSESVKQDVKNNEIAYKKAFNEFKFFRDKLQKEIDKSLQEFSQKAYKLGTEKGDVGSTNIFAVSRVKQVEAQIEPLRNAASVFRKEIEKVSKEGDAEKLLEKWKELGFVFGDLTDDKLLKLIRKTAELNKEAEVSGKIYAKSLSQLEKIREGEEKERNERKVGSSIKKQEISLAEKLRRIQREVWLARRTELAIEKKDLHELLVAQMALSDKMQEIEKRPTKYGVSQYRGLMKKELKVDDTISDAQKEEGKSLVYQAIMEDKIKNQILSYNDLVSAHVDVNSELDAQNRKLDDANKKLLIYKSMLPASTAEYISSESLPVGKSKSYDTIPIEDSIWETSREKFKSGNYDKDVVQVPEAAMQEVPLKFNIDNEKLYADLESALIRNSIWETAGEMLGSSLMTGVDMFSSKLSQELWTIKNLSKVQVGSALGDAAKMFGQEMTRQLMKLAVSKALSFIPGVGPLLAAAGGAAVGTKNAQRGYTLVGEEGPELVYMRGGEEVLTAAETRKELEAPQTALTDDGLEETENYSANGELREILKKSPLESRRSLEETKSYPANGELLKPRSGVASIDERENYPASGELGEILKKSLLKSSDNSVAKYANGTRYARRGFAVVGERGREAIFRRANETASNLSAIQSAGFERREMSAYGSGNDMLANEIRALRQDNQRLNKDLSLVDDAGKVIADKTNRSNLIAKNLKVS